MVVMSMMLVVLGLILVNDINCGDDKSEVDCSEDTTSHDSNSSVDGGPNDDGGRPNDF